MAAAQFFWPLFSVSTFEFAGTRFRHPQTAIFVCYICFARAPKFRAHCAQDATAQISQNIARNSGPRQPPCCAPCAAEMNAPVGSAQKQQVATHRLHARVVHT